jgi:hypothetical protein
MLEPKQGKKKLGFDTPATVIQDGFEKLTGLLAGKKANWEDVNTVLKAWAKEERVKTEKAVEAKQFEQVRSKFPLLYFLVTERTLALLGIEITATQERLARCEKLIEEIKLSRK